MQIRPPAAILVDMDDTILSDAVNAPDCWQVVCDNAAAELPDLNPRALWDEIELARQWYWSDPERHRRGRLNLDAARAEVVALALKQLRLNKPGLADRLALAHAAEREARMQPFPGALETLRRLRERGIRLALVTNGQTLPQRQKIVRFGLAQFFDSILIEGDFGVGKPDERVYRHVLAQLDVAPADTWMVGDNLEWDVAAPQRLGLTGIWIDLSGNGLPPSAQVKPDRIIRALAELI